MDSKICVKTWLAAGDLHSDTRITATAEVLKSLGGPDYARRFWREPHKDAPEIILGSHFVTMFRRSAKIAPEDYLPCLAEMLHIFASRLSYGTPVDAISVAEEAFHLKCHLYHNDPVSHSRDLLPYLDELLDSSYRSHQSQRALVAVIGFLDALKKEYCDHPENLQRLDNLTQLVHLHAKFVISHTQLDPELLPLFQKALTFAREDPQWRTLEGYQMLPVILVRLGDLLRIQSNHVDACAIYKEAWAAWRDHELVVDLPSTLPYSDFRDRMEAFAAFPFRYILSLAYLDRPEEAECVIREVVRWQQRLDETKASMFKPEDLVIATVLYSSFLRRHGRMNAASSVENDGIRTMCPHWSLAWSYRYLLSHHALTLLKLSRLEEGFEVVKGVIRRNYYDTIRHKEHRACTFNTQGFILLQMKQYNKAHRSYVKACKAGRELVEESRTKLPSQGILGYNPRKDLIVALFHYNISLRACGRIQDADEAHRELTQLRSGLNDIEEYELTGMEQDYEDMLERLVELRCDDCSDSGALEEDDDGSAGSNDDGSDGSNDDGGDGSDDGFFGGGGEGGGDVSDGDFVWGDDEGESEAT